MSRVQNFAFNVKLRPCITVLIPMITVAVAFLALLKLQRAPSFPMYLVFLVLSDLMVGRVQVETGFTALGFSA